MRQQYAVDQFCDTLASTKTNKARLPFNDLPYHDFGEALRTPKSSAPSSRSDLRSASVPPPSHRSRAVGMLRPYSHTRKPPKSRHETRHCGKIPKPVNTDPIDDLMHSTVMSRSSPLENWEDLGCRGGTHLGNLKPSWSTYKADQKNNPGQLNYAYQTKGQQGKMPLRIVPGLYMGEPFAPDERQAPATWEHGSTTKYHFQPPTNSDWTKRYEPFKDGVPYRAGKAFDVLQAERNMQMTKKEKKAGTYYSGIPAQWKGPSVNDTIKGGGQKTRCGIKDTYKNGQRPHPLDGGLAPEEYRHCWPKQQKHHKNLIPCNKSPHLNVGHANPLAFANQAFSADAMKKNQSLRAFTVKCSGPRDRSTGYSPQTQYGNYFVPSGTPTQPIDIDWG